MDFKNGMTRSVGRAVLQSKKNSPHIFFGLGIVGVIGSTILACRATLKLEKIVDEIKTDFEQLKEHYEGDWADADAYRRDLLFAYVRGARKLIKLYGPAAAVGGAGIAALAGSHVQLSRRNAALTAALTAVSKAYQEYRGRVRDELGEEKEKEFYQGCLLDDEDDGIPAKGYRLKNGASPYGQYFQPSNVNWHKDMEFNRIFIECQQNYANHLLKARGHVFLNEVYDALGFERSQAGQVVGWLYDGDGDNYIDFGLYEVVNMNFINGNALGCLLDFNVDGVVYDKI